MLTDFFYIEYKVFVLPAFAFCCSLLSSDILRIYSFAVDEILPYCNYHGNQQSNCWNACENVSSCIKSGNLSDKICYFNKSYMHVILRIYYMYI